MTDPADSAAGPAVTAPDRVVLTPWNQPGPRVPRRGNTLTRGLSRLILRLFGWRVTGVLPDLSKFIIAAAPHTSNWDFPLGILAKSAVGLRVSFLGKDALFKGPLGWFMRWQGGRPVDRSAPHGVVKEMIRIIREAPHFVMAIAPEGTRKRVAEWRTGFYHLAHGAGIPIVPGHLDFGRREVRFGAPFWPTGDPDADLAAIRALYRDTRPYRPEHFDPGSL